MAVTRDDAGNVQVDFVWGNFPLQPDADRGENTLDPTLDNHSIATTGYSNFPQFIPNYEGDGDTGFEAVIPKLRGLTLSAANAAATGAGLGELDVQFVTYDLLNVTSSGKAVTVTVDAPGTDLAVGDVVSVVYNDGDAISGTWTDVKITAVNGADFTFSLKTAPSPAYDFSSTGYVFNNSNIVLAIDAVEGDIIDAGTSIPALVLNGD